MTIFSSTSGRGESTGYGVYSTLLRPVSRRGDTPEIPWLARWVGSSAQGGNECNRTANACRLTNGFERFPAEEFTKRSIG